MANNQNPLRVGFIGWGAINRRVAGLLAARQSANVAFVAVCLRDLNEAIDLPDGAEVITEPASLARLKLDIVIEAAGRAAVSEWGEAALSNAGALAVASASAFCDDELLELLLRTADRHGSQLLLPSGALAGIDAIAAASALPLEEVLHRIVKPPQAWSGTAAEGLLDLDAITKAEAFFRGPAREAASAFPQNANVAVISALAGIGLEKTLVELVADPFATGNRHELVVRGDFGKLNVSIENRPLASNPKSSDMAALSLVRLVENRVRSFVR
jgi:aspartate dehydrogenase